MVCHLKNACPRAPSPAVWVSLMWCSSPKQQPAKRNQAAPYACLGCSVWKQGVQERTHGLVMPLGMCDWNLTVDKYSWAIYLQLQTIFSQTTLQTSWPFLYAAIHSCCYLCFFTFSEPAWSQLLPLWWLLEGTSTALLAFLYWCPPSWQPWLHALLKCGTTKYFPHWFTGCRIDVTQVFQPL